MLTISVIITTVTLIQSGLIQDYQEIETLEFQQLEDISTSIGEE